MEDQALNTDIVNVPVPRRYLSSVIHALSAAMLEDDRDKPMPYSSRDISPAPAFDWTDISDLGRLRTQLRSPSPKVLLDVASDRADEWVPYADIVSATGLTERQVRAELGTLTKAIRREFSVEYRDATWPVEVEERSTSEGTQLHYKMPVEVARAWKASASVTLQRQSYTGAGNSRTGNDEHTMN